MHGMEHLDHLNLRDNPLGLTPDLSNMADISSLDLDHTGITEIPRGLLSLNTGAEVDLSHNAITEIPADVLELPPETAEGFNFNGNPLDEASLERLIAYCRRTGIDFGIDAVSERADIDE
jgi:Leucine-rich repeat (LRR) protein